MPVLTRPATTSVPVTKDPRRPRGVSFVRRHRFSLTVLAPSVILLGIFVYGFIGYSVRVSLSQWQGLQPNLSSRQPFGQTYDDLFHTPRFQADLRNVTVFTALLLTLAVVLGLVLALLVHHALAGRSMFRGIFLFPYSLSFIVTGVVWRWIFTPSAGANLILNKLGVDRGPKWITDPKVAGDVSAALEHVIPGGDFIQVKLGIPLAIIPVVIAAGWQLAGFAMANFLAALGTLPEELHEAASLDGAGTLRYHWHIVLPWLRPMIVVVLVLLGHISLKSFDLVYAMSGQGPGFATDVPGIFVFDQTFRALRYNTGAAAAIVMLLLVAAVMVPYLYRSVLREKKS
ncbi:MULTISPECIES: sugar ABC transporter permease [unclassified Streptomyces]|uniref:carbohydrate ABC transporter permease n=1 Tax=unclassified Streptomyces TaxID=2593676 RepID=UPI002E1862B4|nr:MULTISPECIES: sugar ABC transporter permease [unclassified Streptomyces]